MTERPRIDLSSFESARMTVEAAPTAAAVEAHRAAALRGGELRRRLQDLAGRAASDDGLVAAKVNARGLSELSIKPQAMRLSAKDLAAQIVRVADSAREDLDRRRAEALAEAGIATGQVDLDQVSAQLGELASGFRRDGADLQGLVEQFRTRLGH